MKEEYPRLMKSFVYDADEDFCAHAACLGVDITEVVRKTVTILEEGIEKTLDIYVLRSRSWKEHAIEGEKCTFCYREGFLSATIRGLEDEGETSKAHLLCAMSSPSAKIEKAKEHSFRLQTDSNNSSLGNCCFCSNEVIHGGWNCDEKDCDKVCHIYCYFQERKEKLLEPALDHSIQEIIISEETVQTKTPFKHWFHIPKSSQSMIDEGRFELSFSYEDFGDIGYIKEVQLSLNQLEITEKSIFEKVKEISYPRKPSNVMGLGQRKESLCDSHSVSISSYCNCRESKEKIEPEEIHSIFCEDCGQWFHEACVRSNYLGWKPQSAIKL